MPEHTMARVAAHPALYDAAMPRPTLNGTRCGACGGTFFPPLAIGCERCGSADLRPVTLAARGRLHSFATVHFHRGGDIEAPFTVGEIVLDDGPVIRATMAANEGLAIGDPVAADWVVLRVGDDGQETVEPRFRKAENR
jgi:uncharacterized protein